MTHGRTFSRGQYKCDYIFCLTTHAEKNSQGGSHPFRPDGSHSKLSAEDIFIAIIIPQ